MSHRLISELFNICKHVSPNENRRYYLQENKFEIPVYNIISRAQTSGVPNLRIMTKSSMAWNSQTSCSLCHLRHMHPENFHENLFAHFHNVANKHEPRKSTKMKKYLSAFGGNNGNLINLWLQSFFINNNCEKNICYTGWNRSAWHSHNTYRTNERLGIRCINIYVIHVP